MQGTTDGGSVQAAALAAASRGALFHQASQWADMDRWHAQVAEIRRQAPVLRVDDPGDAPFWVLTRHANVTAVSRDTPAGTTPTGWC